MYLISRSGQLTLPLRDQKVHYTPKGDVDHIDQALAVQFQYIGNVPPFAREAVSRLPNWGAGIGMYESGELEDPFSRCGFLDTELEAEKYGWNTEEKEFVERALKNASSNGIEYIVVEAPAAVKPWGRYDEIEGEQAAEQITFYVDQLGLDPNTVLAYERENGAREDVIAAVERLVEKQNEDVVGVISA